MGCGATTEQKNTQGEQQAPTTNNNNSTNATITTNTNNNNAANTNNNGTATPPPAAHKYSAAVQEEEKLAGKAKFIKDPGCVVHAPLTSSSSKKPTSLFVVSAPTTGPTGLTMAYRDLSCSPPAFYARRFTDAEVQHIREEQLPAKQLSFVAVFKSIASDTIKSKLRISKAGDEEATVKVEFDITAARDRDSRSLLRLDLPRISSSSGGETATGDSVPMPTIFTSIVEPMARMIQVRRQTTDDREREQRSSLLQTKLHLSSVSTKAHETVIDRIRPNIGAARRDAAAFAKGSAEVAMLIGRHERKIARAKRGEPERNALDAMYERGGARPFDHLLQADAHVPSNAHYWPELNEGATHNDKKNGAGDELAAPAEVRPVQYEHFAWINYVGAAFPKVPSAEHIARPPTDPILQQLYSNCRHEAELSNVLSVLQRLDCWDFNVFELEHATGGHALFYTTYAVLHKLNLVSDLKIEDATLRRFLFAIEQGYHPNPYHNSTHAADVCQINYYVICVGGLREKLSLSKEELLAAMLAGAVHDYDHPGFNNNFHTKTNAYLSTLYNDRSVLENHHVSCVYEIVRQPQYDIFAGFSDEQKKEVRDTMIEMVLSTDMTQHGRIFGAFRQRLGDSPEWSEKKDDVRLALSMAVKMADVSNCGRPSHLYLEWAKGIATEFYQQGDAEAQLCLPVSPFMDRNRDAEFALGQISFINMVIVGMFEKMAEMLPKLEFTIRFCNENREYWQKNQEK